MRHRWLPGWLALAALAGAAALAADDEPLPPGEAYRYAVTDTGDALEIDWAIEDGYYLYRNKLGFATPTPGILLHDPVLPAGQRHEDEFFGVQAIYRERFYVRVPYSVDGERPATLDLEIRSQGCADIGLCYPPQTWTETVALRPGDDAKLDLAAPLGGGSSGGPGAGLDASGSLGGTGDFLPVDEAFRGDVFAVDGNTVEIGFRLAPGYYLYKAKFGVATSADNVQLGQLRLPEGKSRTDEFFGEQEVYYDEVLARLPVARATPEAMQLPLSIEFQGCADAGLCYPPTTREFSVTLPEATTVTDLSSIASPNRPVSEQSWYAGVITGDNLWVMIGLFFAAGLGLAFTPCVLPMVPIVSGIIAGEGEDVGALRGFLLAFTYVMGMAIVYTAAGVIAGAAGLQLQATFNQPWVLVLMTLLFVALAFGMFGAYDLQMPSAIQSKLAGVSGRQRSGTVIGAFVMGAISALVVTACVAPALIGALTVIAQTGEMLRGGTALFAMSLGMGAPLLAVGAAQGRFLPKSGPWMVAVKGAFGFLFLGLAIWMLSRMLPGSVTMALWASLVFIAGVFLGGLTTLAGDAPPTAKLGKGFGVLAMLYGLLLFAGALTGGSNPLRPLATINLGGGGLVVEQRHLEFTRIKTVDDLDRELAAAAAAGNTTMLDFYADWCVSCIEMEEYTFTDAGVQAALADTILLQADVTRNDDDDQALLERFGVFGPPTIVFFGPDGEQRHGYEVVGFMKAADFAAHVDAAFAPATGLTAHSN